MAQDKWIFEMNFKLRPYQLDAVKNLNTALKDHDGVIFQLPTAGGKTIAAAAMMRDRAARGKQVLFVAHRREILRQASAIFDAMGVSHSILAAGRRPTEHRVQLASSSDGCGRQCGAFHWVAHRRCGHKESSVLCGRCFGQMHSDPA